MWGTWPNLITTIDDILNKPLEVRTIEIENRVAHRLVKRILHQTDDISLKIPTGGRVSNTKHNYIYFTNNIVYYYYYSLLVWLKWHILLSRLESSTDTIRKRSKEISKIREILSVGNEKVQMGDEIKMLLKEER